MWKCASRSLKSVFCKNQCSHNNVSTREARDDKSINCFLRLSPVLLGHFHRSFGRKTQGKYEQFSKNEKKEDPKSDKGDYLNDFHNDLCGALRWGGMFVIGWYLLQPISHRRAIFNPQPSDKCAFSILSKYTRNEYSKLIHYFTNNVQPFSCILPKVEAKKTKEKRTSCSDSEDESDESKLDDLEKAHQRVLGSLCNFQGAHCMEQGNYSEAFYHFQEGALVQHPAAVYNLGVCHEMGLGTNQDFKKAAEMYRKASDLGHATAMYNLAVFYVHGLGDLKVDNDEARKLFKVAAGLGQPDAKKALELENGGRIDDSEDVTLAFEDSQAEREDSVSYSQTNSKSTEKSYRKSDKLLHFDMLYRFFKKEKCNEKTEIDANQSSLDDSGALDLSPESHAGVLLA